MSMSHAEARDAIAAVVCEAASREQAEAAERHVEACPECAAWQDELRSLVIALGSLEQPVPDGLDASVRDLIRQGVPEDPWSVIWEVASELTGESSLGLTEQDLGTGELAEAAELVVGHEAIPPETLVRKRFDIIECFSAPRGAKVYMVALKSGSWVGSMVTESSAPMGGVAVRWEDVNGQLQETFTDRRGTFIVEGHGEGPKSVTFGPPLDIQHGLPLIRPT